MTMICPSCAEKVKMAAQVCPHCHQNLMASPARYQLGCLGAFLILIVIAMVWNLFYPRPASQRSVTPPPAPTVRNQASAELLSYSERNRNYLLAQYMRQNGETCARVTRSFYAGSTRSRQAIWNVRCAQGADWQMLIEPDRGGSVTIARCADLGLVGVRCWRWLGE